MTTDTKVADLPELPKPDWTAKDGVSEGVYSATQVREFGMACYQAALARQEAVEDDIIAAAELRGYRRRQEEEAAQEPVAWYLPSEDGYDSCFRDHRTITSCTGNPWAGWIPLYAAPPAAQAVDLEPLPIDTAPRDGSMVRLLVEFTDHATEDKDGPAWTIGANSLDNTGEDLWQFAGWCWEHDHFTEGKGTPVSWLPLIDQQAGKGVRHG